VEPRAYRGLLEVTGAALLQVFCRDGYESGQGLSIRVFGHCFGVPEDPATGSAAGCLAAYLAQEQYLGGSRVDCAAGQGYALGRPSTLYLRADVVEQSVEVEVGGRIQLVGCGEFYV